MKKAFLLLASIAISIGACFAQAQKVPPTITAPEFVFKEDATFTTGTDNEYIIYKATGYKKAELYNAVLLGLYKLYLKPEQVLSTLDNEIIIVNGRSPYCVRYKSSDYAFSYSIRFLFKDGKIRVDTPIARAFIPDSGEERSNIAGWMKVQDNYDQVKPGFEGGIKNEIMKILLLAFSKTENNW